MTEEEKGLGRSEKKKEAAHKKIKQLVMSVNFLSVLYFSKFHLIHLKLEHSIAYVEERLKQLEVRKVRIKRG